MLMTRYDECPECGVGWCDGECGKRTVRDKIGDQFALDNVDEDFHSVSFPEPRTFQTETIEALKVGWRDGHRCQMVMAPTGAGKSILAMMAMAKALQNGRTVIFAVNRLAIMNQTSQVADDLGLPHGIIQAGNPRRRASRFQIASIATISKRGWPLTDLLVVDEADVRGPWVKHAVSCGGYVVGLSATPFAKGLGEVFSRLINSTTMSKLVSDGVLVPMKIMQCQPIDMAGAERTSAKGEWTPGAQEERGMLVVGDIVSDWIKHRNPQTPKSIVFGSTIAHCNKITREFNEAGITCATFCAETSEDERAVLLKEYRKPDSQLHVLVSVDAIARGFDVPDVSTISMARPLSKSLAAYIQMVGRGMRSAPGKQTCTILDHSGNSARFAEDFSTIYYEGLSELDSAGELENKIRKEPEKKEGAACRRCGYQPCGRRCVACGYEYIPPSLENAVAGEMVEFKMGTATREQKGDLWEQCVSLCKVWGRSETAKGRAAYLYKSIFGVFPRGLSDFESTPTVEVSQKVRNKYKANMIAYRARTKR